MSNWNEVISEEEKAKIQTEMNHADSSELINHEEVIDMFLNWERSF
jgi:predicted transcriptional regulator